mgnify:FL=1
MSDAEQKEKLSNRTEHGPIYIIGKLDSIFPSYWSIFDKEQGCYISSLHGARAGLNMS